MITHLQLMDHSFRLRIMYRRRLLSFCSISIGIESSSSFHISSRLDQSNQIMSVATNQQQVVLTPEEARRRRCIGQLMGIRTQPVKQLPMTLFTLWMSGNDVSIFTIMFLGMALMAPINALMTFNKVFEDFAEVAKKDKQVSAALSQAKLIYIACCFAAFGVGILKLQWMSLLPVCMMDWISTASLPVKERSFGAVV